MHFDATELNKNELENKLEEPGHILSFTVYQDGRKAKFQRLTLRRKLST